MYVCVYVCKYLCTYISVCVRAYVFVFMYVRLSPGNTNIHRITTQGYYDLKIDLEDFEGTTRYALYKNFSLSSENDFFRLSVGAYSGDAGMISIMHSPCHPHPPNIFQINK